MPIIKEEPLKKFDRNAFDFKEMKSEVSEAIVYDHKRDKVDDAKKRAIVDSRNYDDFKSRVAGCHLKSIHRAEFNAPPKFAFNRQVAPGIDACEGKRVASSSAVGPKALSAVRGPEGGIPKNGREFERVFRRCATAEEKVNLVKTLDEPSYVRLFGRELDAQVLMQILMAIDEVSGTAVAPPGTAHLFLGSLARQCPSSTSMAASFLIPTERTIVARLLAREQVAGIIGQDEIVTICAVLGVQPSSVVTAAAQVDASTLFVQEASGSKGDASRDDSSNLSSNGASGATTVLLANTDSTPGAGTIELMD